RLGDLGEGRHHLRLRAAFHGPLVGSDELLERVLSPLDLATVFVASPDRDVDTLVACHFQSSPDNSLMTRENLPAIFLVDSGLTPMFGTEENAICVSVA